MIPFQYARPTTLPDALALLKEHGADALPLAGGTDVLVQVRRGKRTPRVVVDLKRVKELHGDIVEREQCMRIGALALMSDLIEHAAIRRHFPALVEAASVVGSVQIRNRATLAGNICNASPAADTVPPLLVHGATVNLVSECGERTEALRNFFTGPGKSILREGEIVQSIDLPLPTGPSGAAFGRITRRHGVDLATINLCCRTMVSGMTCFAFGAVGPTPLYVEDETGVLADASADSEKKEAVLRALISEARPITDVRGGREYRLAMLLTMSKRTLRTALERMQSGAMGV